MLSRHLVTGLALNLLALLFSSQSQAEPVRSWTELVSSNGYTGVVVSLETGKVHHFREHLFAAEEPIWNSEGEVWTEAHPDCFRPQSVWSRDLLFDAYFGLHANGQGLWLPSFDVDLDRSGYDGLASRPGHDGGTNVIRVVQPVDDLDIEATTRVFAPWGWEGPAFLLLLEVSNTGTDAITNARAFALINTKVGPGRPGPRAEISGDGETIGVQSDRSITETGFAGAVSMIPLDTPDRATHSPAAFYGDVVADELELTEPVVTPTAYDDAAGGFQWNIPTLTAGESRWFGVMVAYSPNPSIEAETRDAARVWLDGRSPRDLWTAELEQWQRFQDRVQVPTGLTDDEEDLFRHSATVLRMAQVRESEYFVAPELDQEDPRFTATGETVPEEGEMRSHWGRGALLASLPPGEWAYAWVRDGAYAIVGLVDAGLYAEARDGLLFFLSATTDRYREYAELEGVPLEPYGVSLTRHFGFGLEECDTICNGDFNFEFDGVGLFLWALRHYVEQSGDTDFLDEHWGTVSTEVADVLEALIEPDTGLIEADSSIWEVHWLGKQKHFTYTSLTASRGLCDAAWLAEQLGQREIGSRYAAAGVGLRGAIHAGLRDGDGALAANLEELAHAQGYWDASVVDAIAMGLFAPDGETAAATLSGLRDNLSVSNGLGLSRTDDNVDTHGSTDLSPYGSEYDAIEWVFIDLRASIAARHMGLFEFADDLQGWIRDQSLENYLLIAENYDPITSIYRNNAPMIGFGAGGYITAMRQRAGAWAPTPSCGSYFESDEPTPETNEDPEASSDGPTEPLEVLEEAVDAAETTDSADRTPDAGQGVDLSGDAIEQPESEAVIDEAADDKGCDRCSTTHAGQIEPLWLLAPIAGLSYLRRRRGAHFRQVASGP